MHLTDKLLGFIFGIAGALASFIVIRGELGFASTMLCFIGCIVIANNSSFSRSQKLLRWIALVVLCNGIFFLWNLFFYYVFDHLGGF